MKSPNAYEIIHSGPAAGLPFDEYEERHVDPYDLLETEANAQRWHATQRRFCLLQWLIFLAILALAFALCVFLR